MSKYRVYELAKEFTTTSKLILDILARNNMPAKNHMASIEEEAYQVLVRTFAPKPDTAEEIRERQRKKAAAAMPVPKVEPPKAPPAPPKVFYGGGMQPRSQMKPRYDHNDMRPKTVETVAPRPVNVPLKPQQPAAQPPVAAPQKPPVAPVAETKPISPTPVKPPAPAAAATPVDTTPKPVTTPAAPAPHYPFKAAPPFNPNNVIRQPAPAFVPRSFENRPAQSGGPAKSASAGNAAGGADQQRPAFNRPAAPGQSRPAVGGRPMPGGNAPQGAAAAKPGPGQKNDRHQGGGKPTPGGNRPGFNKPPMQGQQSRPGAAGRRSAGPAPAVVKQEPVRPTHIKVGESLSVKELAMKLGREVNEVIKKLMMLGVMATINQEVDFDTVSLIAGEFGVTV